MLWLSVPKKKKITQHINCHLNFHICLDLCSLLLLALRAPLLLSCLFVVIGQCKYYLARFGSATQVIGIHKCVWTRHSIGRIKTVVLTHFAICFRANLKLCAFSRSFSVAPVPYCISWAHFPCDLCTINARTHLHFVFDFTIFCMCFFSLFFFRPKTIRCVD